MESVSSGAASKTQGSLCAGERKEGEGETSADHLYNVTVTMPPRAWSVGNTGTTRLKKGEEEEEDDDDDDDDDVGWEDWLCNAENAWEYAITRDDEGVDEKDEVDDDMEEEEEVEP